MDQQKQNVNKLDVFKIYNTLTGIVKCLENHYTTVDLRNDFYVSGKIIYVDGCMNIDMEDVMLIDSSGRKHEFENFFITSRNIRYVHIPKQFSSKSLLQQLFEPSSATTFKAMKKPHTFKKTRALKKHKETVLSAYQDSASTKVPDTKE